ncbi:MAG: Hsp20/alpha crystallin family protein [Campylobacteraceae bacterium]|nr:Hsp20/alpha crystallin family protein [Campylobacteraceae bacterium]
MDIVKSTKNISTNLEKNIQSGLKKTKEVFTNVASHLPFANLAKKNSDTFSIEVDLPGVDKKDIDIKIEDNLLRVSSVRKMKKEVKEDDYYVIGSYFGEISRVFVLPEDIDKDKVDAKYKDGRLYITLEKVEAKKAKSVTIK